MDIYHLPCVSWLDSNSTSVRLNCTASPKTGLSTLCNSQLYRGLKHCRQLIHKLYNATDWTFSKLSSIPFTNTTYFHNINNFFSAKLVGFKDISSPNFENKLLGTYNVPCHVCRQRESGRRKKETWECPHHPL
jgi:hypothetical protein